MELAGTLWINYRLKLVGPCDLNLELFPMDVQVCELVLEVGIHPRRKSSCSKRFISVIRV